LSDYFVNIHNIGVELEQAGYKKEAVELLEKARYSYSASSYDGNQFTAVAG
jgi:hypothetical protein